MVLNSDLRSGYGHDKSKAILPYRDLAHKPTLFFCGDGVSGGFERDALFFCLLGQD
jgi:2-hydroxy-3-keto-5-methylthiopentenyl-1-phosphate phosphatase